MPFVLADNGIIYSETKPIIFEGITYLGFKISYEPNVGRSSNDNYFIYYHPITKEMAWLEYTITFFSKKTSEKLNIIRYHNWENVNGFLPPKSISWYNKQTNGNPTNAAKNPIQFTLPLVSKTLLADSFFEKPK